MRRPQESLRRRGALALILGGWSLMGLFYGLQYAALAYSTGPVDWTASFVQGFAQALVWAALTPAIIWLSGRFRLDTRSWWKRLPVHLAAALAIGPLQIGLFHLAMGAIGWTPPPLPVAAEVLSRFLTYGVLVGIVHGLRSHARFRERELLASKLSAELAEARLRLLQDQLQPHFLFNAMHAISELVHEDPHGAETMIADLCDLLRLSFDKIGVQPVPLSQEIAFVTRYLRIEEKRFEDRLTFDIDVPSELMTARVPHLVLQPLVENALRHGVARREGRSRVELRVIREGSLLSLEVRDSGTGPLTGRSTGGQGVGLDNTRARLEQMYGAQQSLELRRDEQETCATITLPFVPEGGGAN